MALQVYMVDIIATEYEAKCSAIIVLVFQMLVGSVAADTKATKGNADAQHHNPITPQDRDTAVPGNACSFGGGSCSHF